tara:strand:+ start:163145 stop:164539 length:1395 start_codon:yes stop_codon:yes gene_type:complete
MKIYTKSTSFNADLYTPVGMYLSLRDHYRKPCLLESNDYHDRTDSSSVIGLDPIVELTLNGKMLKLTQHSQSIREEIIESRSAVQTIEKIINEYSFQEKTSYNGFLGRINFEAANYLEKHTVERKKSLDLPDVHLMIYKYIIVIDHFKDEGMIIENSLYNEFDGIDHILSSLDQHNVPQFPFEHIGEETSTTTPDEYKSNVLKAIDHVKRGDVFQLVLSRRFSQPFIGEDFEVYRQLRRLNPSPYLYYFDFESYRLMGSSPEAQLRVKNKEVEIHPIAGTVKRTGNTHEDEKNANALLHDEKENAEHMMLVDLARNDLSKHCSHVKVDSLKEVQYFSHVIHLVSIIKGTLEGASPLAAFFDTFPAGTLSGAPKPKALELISKYEDEPREYYGGAVGIIGADQSLNMAIVIRSILSKSNVLHYQAGAGIVLDSLPESELEEVDNKLNAVRKAIKATTSTKKHLVQ